MMDIKLQIGLQGRKNLIYGRSFALIILFLSLAVHSQNQIQEENINLDTSIRSGQLSNGFRYYLKSTPVSKEKVYLKLYHLVGSNQEEPDELNFAHAVEHMAFKATENFPKGINSSPLSEMGLGIYNLGGSSGRKATIYNFESPVDNEKSLDLGLLWFKDIIDGLKLEDPDIVQVGGELRQEFLGKSGEDVNKMIAKLEIYANLFPCSKSYSNFFEHHKSLGAKKIRNFYRKWYRPDLMRLVVVGEFENPDYLEKEIKKRFSSSPVSQPYNFKKCDSEYLDRPPQFTCIKNFSRSSGSPEEGQINIHLFFRDSTLFSQSHNKEKLERLIKRQLVISIIRKRFEESIMNYDSSKSNIYDPLLMSGLPAAMEVVINSRLGKEKKDLQKSIRVLLQLQKYGLSPQEWNGIKEDHLANLENINTERARYWLDEIEKYILEGEILPNKKNKYVKEWLRDLTLLDFNDFMHQYLTMRPMDIGVLAFTGHEDYECSEEVIRSWIEETYQKPVEPYDAPKKVTSLMSTGDISTLAETGKEKIIDHKNGVREIILANGVKVVLKHLENSSSDQKRIYVRGFSPKGAGCFSKEDFFTAVNAPRIVQHSGVNGLNKFQIENYLASTSLMPGSVSPYIDDMETGIYANAELADVEIMLQLIYLYFTRPNKNNVAFEDWKRAERERYANPSYNVSLTDFFDEIKSLTNDNALSETFLSKSFNGTKYFESGQSTKLVEAYSLYKQLFGNARDFTFLIKGDFDEDSLLPLLKKYLGSLPNLEEPFQCFLNSENRNILSCGPSYQVIYPPEYYNMKSIRYARKFIKEAPKMERWKEEIKVEALAEVISHEVWKLRWEKDYSLYMVGVFGKFNPSLDRFEITFVFDVLPEELSMIRQEVEEIITSLNSGELPDTSFKTGINRIYDLYGSNGEPSIRKSQDWLYRHYRYGLPLIDQREMEDFVKTLTSNDLIEVGREYFTPENSFEFVMKNKSD